MAWEAEEREFDEVSTLDPYAASAWPAGYAGAVLGYRGAVRGEGRGEG